LISELPECVRDAGWDVWCVFRVVDGGGAATVLAQTLLQLANVGEQTGFVCEGGYQSADIEDWTNASVGLSAANQLRRVKSSVTSISE